MAANRRKNAKSRSKTSLRIVMAGLRIALCVGFVTWFRHTSKSNTTSIQFGNQDSSMVQRMNRPVNVHLPGAPNHSVAVGSSPTAHIVVTRFILNQGTLLHLARGRLLLFCSVSVPSLTSQTSQDFLWIIETDTTLDSAIRLEMIDAIKHLSNVVVVQSTKSPQLFSNINRRTKGQHENKNLKTIFGDPLLLESYLSLNQDLFMETNLDAGDGLAVDFIENAQKRILGLHTTRSSLRVWCVGQVVEWHYYAPWDRRLFDKLRNYVIRGAMRAVWEDTTCTSAGITVSFLPGESDSLDESSLAFESYDKIGDKLSACSPNLLSMETCYSYFDEESKGFSYTAKNYAQLRPMAFRSRTPMSNELTTLLRKHTRWLYSDHAKSEAIWANIKQFGLKNKTLEIVHSAIGDGIDQILADAIHAQCPGAVESCGNNIDILTKMRKQERRGRLVVPEKLVWEQ